MKRLLKWPAKLVWRWTFPLRRPLTRKVEAMLTRCCSPVVVSHCHVTPETNLLMDHMVRELVRLQRQVELLESAVEGLAAPQSPGLSVVRGPGAGEAAHSAAS